MFKYNDYYNSCTNQNYLILAIEDNNKYNKYNTCEY